jgi:hypothetical protein
MMEIMEFGRGKRVKKFQGFASRNPTLESCTDSYDDKYE